MLTDVFHFHELAVEDALAETHHPKIESYGDYLYLILHGIDFNAARAPASRPRTSTSSSASSYLVTVHPGISRSIDQVSEVCGRNAPRAWRGPGRRCSTASSTRWSTTTGRRSRSSSERLDELEKEVFEQAEPAAGAADSRFQARRRARCGASCCRSVTPSAGWPDASSR